MITESLIAEIINYLDLQDTELNDRLKMVFADKPENCAEINKEDLALLLSLEPEDVDEDYLGEAFKFFDKNGDGDLACAGILLYLLCTYNQKYTI